MQDNPLCVACVTRKMLYVASLTRSRAPKMLTKHSALLIFFDFFALFAKKSLALVRKSRYNDPVTTR